MAPNASVGVNQTLYIRNLPDKMNKEDLKRELYMLFGSYGSVLDIVALKTSKMRGQAHIVFRDVQTSSLAMRELDGFDFFGKSMSISYAKSKSDFIAKLDGTYKMPTAQTNMVGKGDDKSDRGTALQQSVFGGKPDESKGEKRTREESDSEMDMDQDEGEAMEMDESDSD